jgi:DMSO/TMAO reductase YedYZ molybdopterin-dependent catalytic subunit
MEPVVPKEDEGEMAEPVQAEDAAEPVEAAAVEAAPDPDALVRRQSAARTRRSFLVAAVGAAGGYGFYHWLQHAPGSQLIQSPFRKALNFNAGLSRDLFRDHVLAPTYPVGKSVDLRVNGNYGIKQALVPESYRLQMVGVENAKAHPRYVEDVTAWEYRYVHAGETDGGHSTKVDPAKEGKPDATLPPAFQKAFADLAKAQGGRPARGNEEAGESDDTLDPGTPGLLLTMDDITRFPHQELVTQFKCIEGWSEIVHWGGVRLADLIAAYPPARKADGSLPKYVYMETPNGDYYCGYDLAACMHPQSLLVTEMAGKPLIPAHGAPLRLHMPIKYGYKQIKCIGLIAYTDHQPDDYWTKLGYDWYAGL